MGRRRPAEAFVSHVSQQTVEAFTKIRDITEKRERKIYGSLACALGDFADVTSPEHAVAEYKDAILRSSRKNGRPDSTVEMHLVDSLKHFRLANQRLTSKIDAENYMELASKHMALATKYVDLRNAYPSQVSDAYARRKNGTAAPTHHLIWGAHQMGESETRFARKALELAPQSTEVIYETLVTKGRGALLHAIGATSTQLARQQLQ